MWCVTFTRGITPDDVLARYGADPRNARILTRQQADHIGGGDGPEGSLLRAGALGDWSFCFEDSGVMGIMPGPLSALSHGSEAFAIRRSADGMSGFAHWRDGRCTERFEPDVSYTKPEPPHPWWDTVQEHLGTANAQRWTMVPVVEAVARHTGAVFLAADTLEGPLLTLFLEDGSRTSDPPVSAPPTVSRPLGRALGPVVAGPPAVPTSRRAPAGDGEL